NADAAGKEGARSHGRALRAAQAAAAVIAVGGTARRVAVVARGVPQETGAAGEAEALAPGVELVAVVAAEVDQHADAERRHALRGVRRAIAVVAGEIENERGAGQRGAETGPAQLIAVVAGEVDDRREAAHGHVGAAISVV